MLTVTNLRTAFVGPASFTVQTGGCLAISGPSGSGKTLLLRAIADLDPNDGEVSWDGRSRDAMQAPAWREMVGFVPAETGWWADKVAAHFPLSPERGNSEIEALLVELGLPVLALDWDVNRLSTGERHRLGLVRALIKHPQVLMLDEPTASLDEDATAKVERLLRRRLAAGVVIVLVTHDPAQARRIATSSLTMNQGRLAASPHVAS